MTVADRYNRKYAQRADLDRNVRQLDSASDDRIARIMVDPATGISATGRSDAGTTAIWNEHN